MQPELSIISIMISAFRDAYIEIISILIFLKSLFLPLIFKFLSHVKFIFA